MTLDKKGQDFIKKEEGCVLHTYKCAAGVDTIGYGHTAGVKPHQVITQAQADTYFLADIKQFESAVNTLVTTNISQNQFNALVSFAYNLGVGSLKKSTLLIKVNKNPADKTIGDEFNKWCKVNGERNADILGRRIREYKMYSTL